MIFILEITSKLRKVVDEIEKVIVGQTQVIHHTLAACLAGGHVLFEDVPGTGKTKLANTVATVLGLQFSRVQGTPDLLPSELVGTNVFHPSSAEFKFRKGPIFTQVLLFDEINRATPRTQSALLEAMAEGSATVDGETRVLEAPFFVLATANPLESSGVFPLPEAQLDRFLVQLKLGYTTLEQELEMVERMRLRQHVSVSPVLSKNELTDLRADTANVHVEPDVLRYIVQLCRATRDHEGVILGASPRAILYLTSFAQALALLNGRSYVLPDDVQEAWLPVMRHRIQTQMQWQSTTEHSAIEVLLHEILAGVVVPSELTTQR